jgi:hypothetical protein
MADSPVSHRRRENLALAKTRRSLTGYPETRSPRNWFRRRSSILGFLDSQERTCEMVVVLPNSSSKSMIEPWHLGIFS